MNECKYCGGEKRKIMNKRIKVDEVLVATSNINNEEESKVEYRNAYKVMSYTVECHHGKTSSN